MGTSNCCFGKVLRGAGGRRAWAGAALFGALAVLSSSQSPAQTGRLSGKLTDLYSHPVGEATLVLRNTATGVEATTTTGRDGSYRFSGLTPGEYTLDAGSDRLGQGQIAGIYVQAGHESRVQAAMRLDNKPVAPLAAMQAGGEAPSDLRSRKAPGTEPVRALNPTLSGAAKPSVMTPPLEARLSQQPIEVMPLWAVTTPGTPLSTLSGRAPANVPNTALLPASGDATGMEAGRAAAPIAISRAEVGMVAAIAMPEIPLLDRSALNGELALAGVSVEHLGPTNHASTSSAVPGPESSTLSGEDLQALPLAGRHWENFVLDTPAGEAASVEDDGREVATSTARIGAPGTVSVDGASIRLGFGGRRMRGSSLIGPGASEAATVEVRSYNNASEAADANPGEHSTVETRAGGDQLHGQAFLFDRRNFWGARNPFTQWVKESSPATLTTTPVFTPLAYTAPEHEERWGFGVGSVMRRRKLFWFAAYDGLQRNNPGVASVRHPDEFFAQPTNDEMQVLSARLGLSSVNPVGEGLGAYSGMLESLSGLLGPAPRSAKQWVGFGRLDWQAAERHRFTLEGTGARWNSPGGGLTRVAEPYGNHSFGSSRASEFWLLGRWEAFLTPNLLAVSQASVGRQIFSEAADEPSAFENTLNVNVWRQLPQMVVDSRYGFTIGNPSRFGTGSYPDEHLYQIREGVDWVRGNLLVKAGANWQHNADFTSLVRNHTGTYHYATVENFASDALVFAKYGLSNALSRLDQHNCDQRGRAWHDRDGQLHGLGYLPCYAWYSQTMGPTDWHVSTNDLAGFATAQWQPAKRFVLSAALRWEREYFPPPIALVDNPALPLTRRVPSPGNEWGPRLSLAWGSGESRWPVLRAGYGMYFGRTQNSVIETALTQTGSFKGDLNFFMRPTDNLSGGGAPPFPYVLAGEPATVAKPGAVEFAPGFKNPEIHQAEITIEERMPGHVQVAASAIVSMGRRLPVTIDTNFDSATNPGTITYRVVDPIHAGPLKAGQITVPFFASWPAADSVTGTAGRLNTSYRQISELMSRANSTYEAAMLRVSRFTRRGISFHARYSYAHAMDWNPNESVLIWGSSVLDPLDFRQEYGTSDLDMRHSASGMVIWHAPWKLTGREAYLANGWMLSAIGRFHSGLPFTMRTAGAIPEEFDSAGTAIVGLGPGMNGYGGDNRVYGVGRNTYRYPLTWKADVRLGKNFNLGAMRELELMAESFNLFNHQNVTRLETVGYYIMPGGSAGALPAMNFLTGLKTGQTEFGKPLDVNATDFFRPRQFDFGMRMRF